VRLFRAILRTTVLLAVVLSVLVVFVVNPSCSSLPSEKIGARADRLRRDVEALVGTRVPRSASRPEGLREAADVVGSAWESLGLDVRREEVVAGGVRSSNVSVLFGSERAPRVVVGAHYDVYGDLPGADDNASGVAGVIELARLLVDAVRRAKTNPFSHAIELVAWTNEEPPHFGTDGMGSLVHARRLKAEGVPVKRAVSVEMIGYFSDAPGSQRYPSPVLRALYPDRGNFIALVGAATPTGWWLVRRAKAAFSLSSSIPVRSINAPAFVPGVDYSDHRSFWVEGFPALMITDTSFYRNDRYHTEHDVPDSLDYERMAAVVDGLYGIVTME
jgi:Zn-dependent M28 family amino/carboxypeptidase